MSRSTSIFLLAVMLVTGGCQGGRERPANLPPLVPLRVTVLQQGTPVAGAFVRLLPPDASMPWSCGATTGEDGVAVIKTLGEFDGAPEGSYKVLISKLETPKTTGTDLSNLNAPAKPAGSASVNLIDPKYALPNATPLEVKVAKGSPTASFDVGAPVRATSQPPR